MIVLESDKHFSYEMIGEFRSNGEWIHPDRIINSYELIFVLKGTVNITEGETEYSVKENEMLVLYPNVRHYGTEVTDEQVSFYWLHFNTDLPVDIKLISAEEVYDIKYLLKKLLHTAHSDMNIVESADALGLLIYNELIALKNVQSGNRALVSEIKEYVRNRIKENVTVLGVAEYFGYNSDYIGKLFKNCYGMSLKKYIDIQKLSLAKDMLLTSSRSVKEIAFELGFGDDNLFIKFFMYHEKISPVAFRNKFCNTHINNK